MVNAILVPKPEPFLGLVLLPIQPLPSGSQSGRKPFETWFHVLTRLPSRSVTRHPGDFANRSDHSRSRPSEERRQSTTFGPPCAISFDSCGSSVSLRVPVSTLTARTELREGRNVRMLWLFCQK